MKRRDFIKSSLILGAGVPFLSMITASSLYANDFDDYKALVIVELDGGNDAFNTFVPMDSTYEEYKSIRANLSINNTLNLFKDNNYKKNKDYLTLTANPYDTATNELEDSYKKGVYVVSDKDDANKKFGINPMMPEFANLYELGKISLISNLGTLVEPTTKAQIENKSVKLPLFLFAHDHQRRAIYTARADKIIKSGFAGRLADRWSPINGDVGLGISYAGMNQVLIGNSTLPFVLRGEPNRYKGDIANLLNKTYGTQSKNIFIKLYKQMQNKSANLSKDLSDAWSDSIDFTSKNSYGDPIFSLPDPKNQLKLDIHTLDETFIKNMQNIVKMIKVGRDSLGYKRQIFVIKLGGFDFHSAQTKDQTIKLRTLSIALSDFYKALEEINVADKVVLFGLSDFGRTILPNGDGTDHGWGGHSFIMSGASEFNGGKILGEMIKSFKLDSDSVISKKGRVIPTTSIEQFVAPIFDWFGANEDEIENSFPNLKNFRIDQNKYKSAFLKDTFS